MTELITLSMSGLAVPRTGLRVTSLKQLKTSDGVAYTANVREGRKALGVIENHGSGGDTCFVPVSHDGRQAMEQFAAACRRNGEPLRRGDVYEHLVDEYELTRMAKRCEKKRTSLVRGLGDEGNELHLIEVTMPSVWLARGDHPHQERLARNLAQYQPAPRAWQFWDGERWAPLVVPGPAEAAA
ncbi:hypothetical protein ACFVQ9_35335 [Streptomyces goshikiensis]|uniref:hypothetical protein n=1 Tax=Streptomyces goshikiensis TaxID=1942 RepID=UPI0036B40BE5